MKRNYLIILFIVILFIILTIYFIFKDTNKPEINEELIKTYPKLAEVSKTSSGGLGNEGLGFDKFVDTSTLFSEGIEIDGKTLSYNGRESAYYCNGVVGEEVSYYSYLDGNSQAVWGLFIDVIDCKDYYWIVHHEIPSGAQIYGPYNKN